MIGVANIPCELHHLRLGPGCWVDSVHPAYMLTFILTFAICGMANPAAFEPASPTLH